MWGGGGVITAWRGTGEVLRGKGHSASDVSAWKKDMGYIYTYKAHMYAAGGGWDVDKAYR